jgi:hypothetical protein
MEYEVHGIRIAERIPPFFILFNSGHFSFSTEAG